MELYIVRHGETYWNAEKKIQGFSDIELNKTGLEMAEKTGEKLKDVKFDYVFSSPLKRAYETARLMTGGRYNIITDDRLKEMHLGIYEGKNFNEMYEQFHNFFDKPEEFGKPEGGESFEDLVKRTSDFLNTVILPLEGKAERVMIAAHAAAIKSMLIYIRKQDISQFWGGVFQKNCCINILNVKDGQFEIVEEAKILY